MSFAIVCIWLAVGFGAANPGMAEGKILAVPVCEDYGGCDPVILKARGYIRNSTGDSIPGAMITGTENRRRNVNAVEFFDHCGPDLHSAVEAAQGVSDTNSSDNPDQYELLFIVCTDDKGDFAADFDICVTAPGYEGQCLVAEFDQNDDRDGVDFTLLAASKTEGRDDFAVGVADPKDASVCGKYDDCKMVYLKASGYVRTSDGAPIVNATVTATENHRDNVNAIQFYHHCGDRSHYLLADQTSDSTSGSTDQNGWYELLFAVCAEEGDGVFDDEFDADFDICVQADGYEQKCEVATFDQDDDRESQDFDLKLAATPTSTPTTAGPTETPTPTSIIQPTALDPIADVNGDKVINSKDILKILENWHRVIE